jgi:hypothetical protein
MRSLPVVAALPTNLTVRISFIRRHDMWSDSEALVAIALGVAYRLSRESQVRELHTLQASLSY